MAGLDRAAIDEYVVSERQTAIDELAAFLAANELGGPTLPMRVEEGRAIEVISRAVEEMRPDLLVIGTRGRSGLLKVFWGA